MSCATEVDPTANAPGFLDMTRSKTACRRDIVQKRMEEKDAIGTFFQLIVSEVRRWGNYQRRRYRSREQQLRADVPSRHAKPNG
jgi:hypothetical protein